MQNPTNCHSHKTEGAVMIKIDPKEVIEIHENYSSFFSVNFCRNQHSSFLGIYKPAFSLYTDDEISVSEAHSS